METMETKTAHYKAIKKEIIIDAPRSEVWKAFSTTEGAKSFLAPSAWIELRLGGAYEIYFLTNNEPGSRGSEGCRVLSFIPEEMLSFTWNAPPQFPEVRFERTFVVIQFADEEDGKTKVRLTHAGWKQGGQWDEVYAYFDKAWGVVLANLQKRFGA